MRNVPSLIVVPAALLSALPALAVEYATEADARRTIFPQADAFADASVTLTKSQRREIERRAGSRQRWETQVVRRALQDGRTIGWLLVDEVVGKHDYITYAVGITLDGRVAGIEVLVYRETYGYQIHEAGWRATFQGKTLADPFQLDVDVPNISGATLSCRNVSRGVKRLLALYELVLADAR